MEKTKQVNNWKELLDFIEKVNTYKDTVVLVGWIGQVQPIGKSKYKVPVKSLIFSTRPVEILKVEKKNEQVEKHT
jgi:hypothetical protein